jgi:ribonuclease HI
MPWIEALLRGKRVYARTKSALELDVQLGRVEVRYSKTDARAYHANVANLEVDWSLAQLPDDGCAAQAEGGKVAISKEQGAAVGTDSAPPASARANTGSRRYPIAAPSSSVADSYVIYTDGACSGNPGPAGLGVVLSAPDGSQRELYEYLGEATNNVAELTAVWRAVQALPNADAAAVIHTDSQYAIGVLSKGWKAKANQTLIASIRASLKGRPKVSFVYVRGHAGIPLNERADELARLAVTSRASGER